QYLTVIVRVSTPKGRHFLERHSNSACQNREGHLPILVLTPAGRFRYQVAFLRVIFVRLHTEGRCRHGLVNSVLSREAGPIPISAFPRKEASRDGPAVRWQSSCGTAAWPVGSRRACDFDHFPRRRVGLRHHPRDEQPADG